MIIALLINLVISMDSDQQSIKSQVLFGQDLGLYVEDMCSEQGTVFIYPCCRQKQTVQQLMLMRAYNVAYRGDDYKIQELMQKIQKKAKEIQGLKVVVFQLSNGQKKFGKNDTVGDVKNYLGRESIDGLVLFVIASKDPKNYMEDNCAPQQMFFKHPYTDNYKMNIFFRIPNTKYCFNFEGKYTDVLKDYLFRFFDQFYQVFHIRIWMDNVSKLIIQKGEKVIQIQEDYYYYPVKFIENIFSGVTINIMLKQKIDPVVKEVDKSKILKIVSQDGNFFEIFAFSDVKFMCFKNLYEEHFSSREKRKKETNVQRILKVMNTIVKEKENLSKLAFYFSEVAGNNITLVGQIVTEGMIFNHKIYSLVDSTPFMIEDYISDENGKKDQDFVQKYINQPSLDISKKSEDQYFKKYENVKPFVIYSSNALYYDNNNSKTKQKKGISIFSFINSFLRSNNHFLALQKQSPDWELMFTRNLLTVMAKLKATLYKIVYRGVNYQLLAKKGEIITFKSFTSTSTKKSVAQNFIFGGPQTDKKTEQQNGTPQTQNDLDFSEGKTLFQIWDVRGKSIQKFSVIPKESQILLQPFTQFEVVADDKFQMMRGQKIRKFILRHIHAKAQYLDPITNFVIWVDDKIKEGKQIYTNIATDFKNSTYLIQLKSTEELRDWLDREQNHQIFNNQKANVVFLTNMTRGENQYAGVEGIIELQNKTKDKDIPIFVYVYNLQGAKKKLAQYKKHIKNFNQIKVGADFDQVQTFLKDNFENKNRVNWFEQLKGWWGKLTQRD